MTRDSFIVCPPRFDPASGHARFTYQLGDLAFTETLIFPEGFDTGRAASPAFARTLELTALVLGVSYFKLRAPFTIAAPGFALSAIGREFVLDVYENGLGEFYARNNLKRFGRLGITASGTSPPAITPPSLDDRALMLIGGGKDSLVSSDLYERAGLAFTPFAVNPRGPILTSVARIGIAPIFVSRALDPEMITLSNQPGFYNGHVPSTAINSMIAALGALLFGYDRIILSNERSASEGNIEFDGRLANHQYSKSLQFERRIAGVLGEASGGALGYFSLLRPFSELKIARMFARTTRFDRDFSSCNKNFRLTGHDGPLWCGTCPKCHFVFLILAAAMDKRRLTGIFGQNLLDNDANQAPYRELTGLVGHKPWECVGEILEAAAALWALDRSSDWRNDKIVTALHHELVAFYGTGKLDKALSELMTDSPDHFIPPSIAQKVMPHAL